MRAMACAEERAQTGFEHQAVFYRGLGGLVAAVVPFVREGVERAEPVLVALLPERVAAVREALGAEASGVRFVDMAELGGNPACIIPEWRRFLDEVGHRGPVRGVGEPLWSGRRDAEVEEASLHEALLNVAFDGGPAWQLVCPYDIAALPPEVIEEAARNHPVRVGAEVSTTYDGHGNALARFGSRLPPAPRTADEVTFVGQDLAGLRGVVARLAGQAGLGEDVIDDLVLAAHELATNSVIHGGGRGVLRAWTEPGAFVAEIEDDGVIEDPLVGRGLLQDLAENGRGIWMANQLCDLVQVRSGEAGTTVRFFAWL